MHQLGQAVKIYFLWFVIIFFIQMVRRVCEDFFFTDLFSWKQDSYLCDSSSHWSISIKSLGTRKPRSSGVKLIWIFTFIIIDRIVKIITGWLVEEHPGEGTVVGPSRAPRVLIFFVTTLSFSSLCRTLAVTGSNGDLSGPKCRLFSFVQGN